MALGADAHPEGRHGLLMATARLCYSPLAQTRAVWGRIPPEMARDAWFRFHFIQASLLNMTFLAAYAALGGALIYLAVFEPASHAVLFLGCALVLAGATQMLLFSYLAAMASHGYAPHVPLFGGQAQRLAQEPDALERLKL